MFDFGDEIILGNYKIPWLIWIQLVVTFLLIILLYYFCFFALDLSDNTSITDALFLSKNSHIGNSTATTSTTSCLNPNKVGESRSIRGEVATSTSRRIIRGLDIQERDEISTKNTTHFAVSENPYHPCHYFELAKQVFLKCFGLMDYTSDCSSTMEQNKED